MAKYLGYVLFILLILLVLVIWPHPEKVVSIVSKTDTVYLPGKVVKLPGKKYKVPYPVYYPLPGGGVDSGYILAPVDTVHQDSIITDDLCFWYDISLKKGYLSEFTSKYLVNEKLVREITTITKQTPESWHIYGGSFVGYKSAGVSLQYSSKKKIALQYQYDIYNNNHTAGVLYRLK